MKDGIDMDMFVIGCVIGLVFGFLMGALIMGFEVRSDTEAEAVRNGAAYWDTNENGCPVFCWGVKKKNDSNELK